MNNKELIEEIAERINSMRERNAYYYLRENGELVTHEAFADSYAIAAELAKYYQPKLPEGSVTIPEVIYEDMKHYNSISTTSKLIEKAYKQAIKEFAEKFKEICRNKKLRIDYSSIAHSFANFDSGCEIGLDCLCEDIDALLKEVGVDLCE